MRCFLALKLSERTREQLAIMSERLQEWELPGRWVDPNDFHVTLLYFGECDDDTVRYLPYSIEPLVCALNKPQLNLPGIGAFAGKHFPRTVYAAVEDPDHFCLNTYNDLAADLSPAKNSKRFYPHITLCRPNGNGTTRSWAQLFEAFGQATWGPCDVEAVGLYRSDPTRTRNRYSELASWPLLPT